MTRANGHPVARLPGSQRGNTGNPGNRSNPGKPRPMSAGELLERYTELRPPLIHGLLRSGEVGNLIAAPKMRKSWLVLSLALSVATGRPWLGRFETVPGRVLIIDNELHGETIADRLRTVAGGMGLRFEEYADLLDVYTLRGRLQDLDALGKNVFRDVEPGAYSLIILDAMYRLLPADAENDNSAMSRVYNTLDSHAGRIGCGFVCVHHSSKGVQGGKSITDVGAGAGAQSRAADLHAVIREHEEPDAAVLDAVVRSYAPIPPVGLRWRFPEWEIDEYLDVTRIKREKGPGGRKPKAAAVAGVDPEVPWTTETFVPAFVRDDPIDAQLIIARATERKQTGCERLTERAASRLLLLAHADGLIHLHKYPGDRTRRYAKRPQTLAETAGPLPAADAPTSLAQADNKTGRNRSKKR